MSTKKLQVIGLKYSGGPGNDGKDGFSPIATVTQTETGATISIEDANGITTAIIEHGKDGSDYVLTDSDKEEIAEIVEERVASYDEVYVGSGDMPEGCTLQIDPESEADEMIDKYAREQIAGLTKDIATKVSEHNVSDTAHNDIRLLVQGLTTRLNALADSDDTTLDQVSEIVAYIKSNKTLIDSITTSKVNVADIIDNLTTSASNKPLSAKQGVALKALIDAITVPTKTSQLTNDSKYQTDEQVQDIVDTALAGLELPSGDGEWRLLSKITTEEVSEIEITLDDSGNPFEVGEVFIFTTATNIEANADVALGLLAKFNGKSEYLPNMSTATFQFTAGKYGASGRMWWYCKSLNPCICFASEYVATNIQTGKTITTTIQHFTESHFSVGEKVQKIIIRGSNSKATIASGSKFEVYGR